MTSASAVSVFGPPFQISRSKPMASNIPHLVGMRADAIRQSAPDCAVAPVLYSCVDIGADLITWTYSAATGVVALAKFGGRFSRNAENASFASAERSRSKNS